MAPEVYVASVPGSILNNLLGMAALAFITDSCSFPAALAACRLGMS